MYLTVAMKVIGGFAVSCLLLVILGVSSLASLNSIDQATDEVSSVAVPTVSLSAMLEAAFLNMGRLTFEAYISEEIKDLDEKKVAFTDSRQEFESTLAKLKNVVKNDEQLRSALGTAEAQYELYISNASNVFENHKTDLELAIKIAKSVSTIEEQTDDASSLLLDFAYLDAVSDSAQLERAAAEGASLESSILAMLSSVTEFAAVKTLQRAEIRAQEVDVFVAQVQEKLATVLSIADGQDDTGALDETQELIDQAIQNINGPNGVKSNKYNRLNKMLAAESALAESDKNIADAQRSLSVLLNLASKRSTEIKDDVSSQVTNSISLIIGLIVISVAGSAFIGYKSVTAITTPLKEVNALLKIASSGDLTHRLDDRAKDEFGELSKNCNALIDSLTSLIKGINSRAAQLAAASNQTSTITAQTTISIEEQKSQISQIAAATTEMHSTSELVSQSADDTLKEIKNADNEAEKVKKISLENKHTIEVLARDVQDAADVINKLHQDSASIGGILDVIRGVADQTNLLALNAAIEAARAGEQGRGFAVVADEVRTLASRTQKSTQEINAMIEVLQAGAERAVSVMNQGRDQTEICVAQTEKATQALDVITDAVHKAFEVSSRIEQAAREQHTVSSEISERLENIVGIAEETTVGAQQTTASSAQVAKLALELQESIGEFKV